MINKSNITIKDMILGYWTDASLGDFADDFVGCDTVLSLGYTWNSGPDDLVYGNPCPAVGYDFFQGPIVSSNDPLAVQLGLPDSAKFLGEWRHGYSNLPMTAFTLYINPNSVYRDPSQGNSQGSVEFYNYLKGLVWNGEPFVDPHTNLPASFVCAGDPVAGTGWYEGAGWPGGLPPVALH